MMETVSKRLTPRLIIARATALACSSTSFCACDFTCTCIGARCILILRTFDALAAKANERLSWLDPRYNRRHVMVWLVVFGLYVSGGGKGRIFESEAHFHLENQSRFVHIDETGRLSCAVNPLHCEPFNIEAELRCWSALGGSDDTPCGNLVR